MNECQLDKEPFYQCCCKYSNNKPVRSIGGNIDAYVCIIAHNMDEGPLYWSAEHSCGCEMYDGPHKRKNDEP
jgi:hypothetical protein